MQRFGHGPAGRGTADVGRLLLQRNFEGAVRAILGSGPGEDPAITEAKSLFLRDGNLEGSLRALPRFCHQERSLLNALLRFPNGWLNALMTLPKSMLTMYLHAYQSRLFNQLAIERVEKLGTSVVEGDLVLLGTTAASDSGGGFVKKRDRKEVHIVTAEDVGEGRFGMRDVHLPLVGFEVELPRHAVGERALELLKLDSLSIADLRNEQQHTLSCGGDYRAVMCFPEDLRCEVVRYTDPDASLLDSDWDRLMAPKDTPPPAPQPPSEGENVELGLKLSLTLPSSAYATMAIRELTKESSERGGSSYTNTNDAGKRPRDDGGGDAGAGKRAKAEAEA
uniref:TRUD domain-containing protein n=2 Tax=Phaeomonas parva TaxID=124430 RepID=A0A7S1TS40_9STRA|mmetsp:Transcript_14665/g.44049  ORF Transcript_14665/g.44049 Transcript_14665/m.44049 type:complete len:336 (+) Transcript_14665:494-1501(+)